MNVREAVKHMHGGTLPSPWALSGACNSSHFVRTVGIML
jgi:hypothetical protein